MSSLHATVNGRVMDSGRTHRREDGSYESYDLKDAVPGDTLLISTLNYRGEVVEHELTKLESGEHEAAVDNWAIAGKIGIATIVLLNRMKGGGPMLTHGIVLREKVFELGAVWPEAEVDSNIIHNLGQIASMASVNLVKEANTPDVSTEDELLDRDTVTQ